MITTVEAADILGVSDSRVRSLIRSGFLPAKKIGHGYELRREIVKHFAKFDRRSGRPSKEDSDMEEKKDGENIDAGGCADLLG